MRVFFVFLLAVLLSSLSLLDAGAQTCTVDSDCGIGDMCATFECRDGFCATQPVTCPILVNRPCEKRLPCDPELGCLVEDKEDGTSCVPDGFSACINGGECASGQCKPFFIDCDDMNECTADSCDVFEGCFSEPVEDGIACDGGEGVCSAGLCVEPACDCASPDAITQGFPIHNKTLFVGTHGDDIICGTDSKDVIFGLAGNDCIDAGDGKDKAFGGFGHDLIFMGPGNDIAWGGPGDDEIDGGEDTDKIIGGFGYDICSGEQTWSCEE